MGTKRSWAVVVVANMWMLPITCCKPSTSSDFARADQPTKEPLVGGVGGVDSHLLQLNLACLRGSTLFAASRLRSTGPYPYP